MATSVYNSTESDEDLRSVTTAERFLDAVQIFNQVCTPLLCLFGAVGNCLSVTVFCRTSTHRSLSASFYLSALAISDTGFLLNLLAVWLNDMGVPVITSSVTCPLVMYLGQVTCFLSVWFIVAFTMERFFAVCYPLTRPTVCTVARAKKVITILTIVALLGFSYVLVIATVMDFPLNRTVVTTPVIPYDGEDNSLNENQLGSLERNSSLHHNLKQLVTDLSTEHENMMSIQGSTEPGESIRISTAPTQTTVNISIEFTSLCSVRPEYHYFSSIASHIDSVLTLILPFGIIAYLNVRIAHCVWRLQDQRANLVAVAKISRSSSSSGGGGARTQVGFVYRSSTARPPQTPNNGRHHLSVSPSHLSSGSPSSYRSSKTNLTVDFEASESSSTSTTTHCCSDFSTRKSNNNRGRVRKGRLNGTSHAAAETRVTKTLLLVSTVFLVLNLPSHAIRAATFIESFWELNIGGGLFAAQQWANILFNMNFSVNFLLYCVSGRKFRASVKSIFCRVTKLPRYPKSKQRASSPSTYGRQSPMESHSLVRARDSFYPASTTEVETYA